MIDLLELEEEISARCKSSSDFFLDMADLSMELDRVYRLDVDFDLVKPVAVLDFNFRPDDRVLSDSKSLRVSLTMSGAGSSLSLMPVLTGDGGFCNVFCNGFCTCFSMGFVPLGAYFDLE